MSPVGTRRAGPRALLVQLDSLQAVLAVHARLEQDPLAGQVDVLAAARTVLITFASGAHARAARGALAQLDAPASAEPFAGGDPVRIEVVYDGEDLAAVARLTGLDPDGVVAAHTGQLWTAAFGGFAPGFAYLIGENDALTVPRRTTPRTAVPAGAVALADTFSAVYPRRSPGGWQLIGRTEARLWDLDRDQPALLRPGTSVQYVAVREAVTLVNQDVRGAPCPAAPDRAGVGVAGCLEVIEAGPLSLIQDLGRPGHGDVGVPASGAADTASARQANRLVGNLPTDAVIETVLGGLTVRAQGELTAALAGAVTPARIRGADDSSRPAPMDAPFALHDGERLHLGPPTTGLRTYLAVRGGIDVPLVLGSRSTDVLSGLGPDPLSAGTVLPVGEVDTARMVGLPEVSALTDTIASGAAGPAVLRITPGPRDDWFTPASREGLTEQTWLVTDQSNRIGIRLALPDTPGSRALERAVTDELPSEGVVAGSLQVPPSGLPVVFLADHPVTGGYPVIGVVVPEDLPVAAQLGPGTSVVFVAVDAETLQPLPCTDAALTRTPWK
ncbi:5-oxoprolinase/urea amidolyase family protein [Arthrobacter echini]|uniref:5-oxoprolinase/urea amidolyase family protein n=1 Tax=Arthrobacter echini TaxID=1529066 RepID=A0A4V3Z5P6_9MICC|nr:urea amidolyase family protein [Arthrobacter echini]THJ67409.1 5-oxoprolinase/urea amidolyase family protein [Arthrobacter echini]